MTNYDSFAPFYDATMGDRSDVISIIRQQIKLHRATTRSILELGCGTGSILAGLVDDYDVSGIDLSSKMLQIAQRKLPSTPLSKSDITNFDLNNKFDCIICVFDTINHLPDITAWRNCFNSTRQHLPEGGLFIFDMNTIGRIQKLTQLPPLAYQAGSLTTHMAIERVDDTAVDWNVTVESLASDGVVEVHEDHARERSYPLAEVADILDKAGFHILNSFDSFGAPASDDSDRVYWVCQLG